MGLELGRGEVGVQFWGWTVDDAVYPAKSAIPIEGSHCVLNTGKYGWGFTIVYFGIDDSVYAVIN